MKRLNLISRHKGQSLTEFALALPLLLALMLAIMDFGRLLFTYTQASNSVRNALRYGVILGYEATSLPNYLNCGEMENIARQVWFANLGSDDVRVEYRTADYGTIVCTESTDPEWLNQRLDNGDILHISLTTTVDLITPFLAQPLALNIEGQRTIVRNIELPRLGGGGGGSSPPDPSEYCDGIIADNNTTADVDTDGLGDLWECVHFGDIADADAVPDGNPDGDLCDNTCEYNGGASPTNPNDPTSPNITPGAPTQLTDPGANACSVLQSMRYVGLSWPQLTGYDVIGYHVYATPANGSRTLIGDITNIPANPDDPVQCGYSQDGVNVDGISGCFNAITTFTPSQFWSLYGSKTIDYSVRAYSAIGESRYSNLTAIDCVFRVENIQLRPEDQGLNCVDPPRDLYTGLQWTAHPDAVQYRIYAAKIDYDPELEPDPPPEVGIITAIPGLATMVCGYSVDGITAVDVDGNGVSENIQGCFNQRRQAWNPATDYTTFMVVPENSYGIIGPYAEAIPPHGMLNPPKCK